MEADTIEKVYFSTKEVAEEVGVSQSAIRFYCSEFKIRPHRTRQNYRKFTKVDLDVLKRIHYEIAVEGRHLWKIREIIRFGV